MEAHAELDVAEIDPGLDAGAASSFRKRRSSVSGLSASPIGSVKTRPRSFHAEPAAMR